MPCAAGTLSASTQPDRAWPSRCSATWPRPGAVILVPGSDTTLATFDSRGTASPGGAARSLAAQVRKLDPGARLAIIAWLGYADPATLSPGALTSGDAGQGADALRPFVDDMVRHGRPVALICHSYGSVVSC